MSSTTGSLLDSQGVERGSQDSGLRSHLGMVGADRKLCRLRKEGLLSVLLCFQKGG
jgi:hypothetical protein